MKSTKYKTRLTGKIKPVFMDDDGNLFILVMNSPVYVQLSSCFFEDGNVLYRGDGIKYSDIALEDYEGDNDLDDWAEEPTE